MLSNSLDLTANLCCCVLLYDRNAAGADTAAADATMLALLKKEVLPFHASRGGSTLLRHLPATVVMAIITFCGGAVRAGNAFM